MKQHKPHTSPAQGSPFPQCLSQIQQAGGEPDSLPITAITHPHTWLWSVRKKKKRNCFNFPAVQGQISLLAQRAVNFSRGPFSPYSKFVFSGHSCCKPEQLQEVWGILAAPSHLIGFAGVFCPLFLALGTGRHHPEGSTHCFPPPSWRGFPDSLYIAFFTGSSAWHWVLGSGFGAELEPFP